jgi:phage/plasmid-like protein (TIGR03299 family)
MSETTVAPIARIPAWRSVGSWVQTPEHAGLRASQILSEAGLDWTVEKTELSTVVPTPSGVTTIAFDDKVAVSRFGTDGLPVDVLGVVGKDYVPVQNYEMTDLLDGLVDGAGASFEAAGSYRRNRSVFVSMRLPEGFRVGDDESDVFLFLENSHDGGGALHLSVTGLRLFCTNQIKSIRNGREYGISFRHTKHLDVTSQRVREAINLTVEATEQLSADAARLLDTPMTTRDFVAFTETLVPTKESDSDRVLAARLATREALLDVFLSPTNANIAQTRWAAWNAVSEYDQWVRPVRGADRSLRQMENRTRGDSLTGKAGALLLS